MKIWKEFTFEAAHCVANLPSGHKCARLHGHSFHVTVEITGPVEDGCGWVMDFADIRECWRPVEEQIDHRYLNEIPGLENPTSENIARWIWTKLLPSLPILSAVTVQETPNSGARYEGQG